MGCNLLYTCCCIHVSYQGRKLDKALHGGEVPMVTVNSHRNMSNNTPRNLVARASAAAAKSCNTSVVTTPNTRMNIPRVGVAVATPRSSVPTAWSVASELEEEEVSDLLATFSQPSNWCGFTR